MNSGFSYATKKRNNDVLLDLFWLIRRDYFFSPE